MSEKTTEKRIRQARETRAAIARVEADPSPENIAGLHRLHAAHLREDGDGAGAAEADARAERVEARARPSREPL